ncbi:type III-B CRISPR module-associated protein Cmr5 [Thiolapillus sp.]
MAAKTCNGCMFKEGCIYNYLFETPPPPGAKRMKSYPSVPHPYVFTVPAEREKENCYVVEFVLVGKYALEKVEGLPQGKSSRQAQELVSQASSLPAMIRINGLGQAVAFYRMKGGVHRGLYELLSGWLCAGGRPYAGFSDLIEGITQSDMHTYRMAQFEAEQLLSWVKKFAKAFAPEQGQVVEEAGVGEGSP